MVGSMIMGFGMLFFFFNMLRSWRHGVPAPENPWE
jgi:cytochrome c oxidase subunit 1